MRSFLLMILLCCFGCSSVERKTFVQEVSQDIKIDLVFEKSIQGVILGSSLSKPFGLAKDFHQNIFLTDAGNNRILKFDSLMNPLKQIGGFGTDNGLLNYPTYISFDNGLNLMVSDENNQRISRYNSHLQYVDEIIFFDEEEPLKFGAPSGITFTIYGETWIADRDNNQIAIYNNIGKYSHSLGQFGYSGGQLLSPEKIIKDDIGNFLVCDAGNKRIVLYDEFANFIDEYTHPYFEYPTAVAISGKRIYVLDAAIGSIFCLNMKGQLLGEIGSLLLGDKLKLKNPSDILFISKEKILIVDKGNDRVVIGKLIIDE